MTEQLEHRHVQPENIQALQPRWCLVLVAVLEQHVKRPPLHDAHVMIGVQATLEALALLQQVKGGRAVQHQEEQRFVLQ